MLVSSVFLVQNRYYADQLSRSQAHDNARMVTELVGSEVRSVMANGVTIAQNKRLVVRSPMALAVVCGQSGAQTTYVQMEGGQAGIDTLEVSGFAVRNGATSWTYYSVSWSNIKGNGGSPAGTCASNGADTAGVSSDYLMLRRLRNYTGSTPTLGMVLMLYRQVDYQFKTSTMDASAIGLYRGLYGGTLTEYVTGMDSTAQFQYRTGGSTYATSVTGGALANIDAIRIVAEARRRVAAGATEDVTYGWSVNVPLRNMN